jgi:multicomponent Na+:H+ antiporter subunit A
MILNSFILLLIFSSITLYTIALIAPSIRINSLRSKFSPLVPLLAFTLFALTKPQSTEVLELWSSPSLPFSFSIKYDGLAKLFSLLITGIGTLIFAYAGAYMKDTPYTQRLLSFLMIFMLAMLGVVLSDNLLMLFLFWELTSISSFFLIGFKNEDTASQRSAMQALTITGLGGLTMLGGFILLGEIAQTYSISQIIGQRDVVFDHPWLIITIVLILAGAFTKSAQFPFHFWLPGAMKAPTPVSAYLHSATMVKAGVYLLARLNPVFGPLDFWSNALLIFGGITMLYAAFQALFKTDMKAILAYTTVSALGVMVFLIGLGTANAIIAVSLFILVHALYKASFFMLAGTVDHETGTRDIRQIRGLGKTFPLLFGIGMLAAWSNGGIPPSVGFLGKDLIYESTLNSPIFQYLLTGLSWLTNVMLFAAGLLVAYLPFRKSDTPTHPDLPKPKMFLWLPPAILAVLGIVFGLLPVLIESSLVKPVAASVFGKDIDFHLALWHGFNTVLVLSLLTLAVGTVLYFILQPKTPTWIQKAEKVGPAVILNKLAEGFITFAAVFTKFAQNGKLRIYLIVILLTLGGLLGYVVLHETTFVIDYEKLSQITIYEAITVGILIISIFLTLFSGSRLAAVAAMGVIGYALCIIFVFYSAPDLAMTQFTIDTLTVILFVLVLYRLPRFIRLDFSIRHILDGLVALMIGALMTIISLEVLGRTPIREISDFYAMNSYMMAKGKNVVNVILVDFRGTDTMIEIVVLSIAAIGVYSLLKLRLRKNEKME